MVNNLRFLVVGMMLSGASFSLCSAQTLSDSFLNPPQEARPRVWWHWMNGNITKDGIRKDLLWMKRSGIGGFHNFDAGTVSPQIVEKRLVYMDEGWKDAFRYSTYLADSLGMEMAVASAPGWSNTGGPWVKPEQAMKKLTWRTTDIKVQNKKGKKIEGGYANSPKADALDIQLPKPYKTTGFFQNVQPVDNGTEFSTASVDVEWYQDIAVIAVRLPEDERSMAELEAKVSASGGHYTVEQLTDGDLAHAIGLPADDKLGYAWIQYEFPQPITIKALTISDGKVRNEWACAPADVSKHLEVSQDGINFIPVCDIPHGGTYQQTIDIPATTSRYFRMCFDNPTANGLYDGFYGIKPKRETLVSEFVLHTVSKINHAEEKAGFATPHDMMDYVTPSDATAAQEVIDVTKYVNTEGKLHWKAPEGKWRIYRFGYSLTGKKNHPAPPEATGLEVDKLDRDAVRQYITHYINSYRNASGGLMGARGLQYILIDSYEAGWETWTRRMTEEFEQRRGYSVLPWLPVLTGQIIGNTEQSERFLWDWRKTIGELISENLYAEVAKVCKENGLKCYFESHENGRMYLADGIEAKKYANIPMAAMWALEGAGGADHTMSECDIRESAAVAHLYGQNIVALESFTSNGLGERAYSFYPGNLKPVADLAMSCGVNRFIIHESAHQPVDSIKPGLGLLIFGQWFNRHETWAEQAHAWTDYLARSSYMLQQGHYVADVLYFYGEDNCITGLFAHQLPQIAKGYSFDYVNADALLNDIQVEDGQLKAPSGNRYRLLWLDKNCRKLSPAVLQKLEELVEQGVCIGMELPDGKPQLVGPNVFRGLSMEQALYQMKIQQDFRANDLSNLRFVHRSTPQAEIYWVSNRQDQPRHVSAYFRVTGRKPLLYRPETGKCEAIGYQMLGDSTTTVEFDMTAHDAVFIVFEEPTSEPQLILPDKHEEIYAEITTPWQVSFEGMAAPDTKTFPTLKSLTENADPKVKYFSGTAIYRNTFILTKKDLHRGRYLLNLGKVGVLAEVVVNGQQMGTLWKSPYDIDITEALKKGENQLEIRVVNLWKNRLIGDKVTGEKNAFPAFDFFNKESQLMESGLMGPVTIHRVTEGKPCYTSVKPGILQKDTDGKPIQAHGFSVVYDEKDKCYYWYGEDKTHTTQGSNVWTYGIRCYRSKDFYNWEDCGHLLFPDTVNTLSPIHYSQGLDRPHIIYNKKTKKWVCWFKNLDDHTQFFTVLQADRFMGPYKVVNSGFRPNGYEAGDFDLYVDDKSGKAYVWFERPHWEMICCELTDDYLGVKKDVELSHHYVECIPPLTREAPTHFVRNGKHYIFSSGTSGYYPNESLVSTFTDYHGEYRDLGNPHLSDKRHTSFYSQITDVVKIPGKHDLYVAVADRWMPQLVGTDEPREEWKRIADRFEGHQPNALTDVPVQIIDRSKQQRNGWDVTYNARYVFLPITWQGEKPVIEWKDEWKLEDYE